MENDNIEFKKISLMDIRVWSNSANFIVYDVNTGIMKLTNKNYAQSSEKRLDRVIQKLIGNNYPLREVNVTDNDYYGVYYQGELKAVGNKNLGYWIAINDKGEIEEYNSSKLKDYINGLSSEKGDNKQGKEFEEKLNDLRIKEGLDDAAPIEMIYKTGTTEDGKPDGFKAGTVPQGIATGNVLKVVLPESTLNKDENGNEADYGEKEISLHFVGEDGSINLHEHDQEEGGLSEGYIVLKRSFLENGDPEGIVTYPVAGFKTKYRSHSASNNDMSEMPDDHYHIKLEKGDIVMGIKVDRAHENDLAELFEKACGDSAEAKEAKNKIIARYGLRNFKYTFGIENMHGLSIRGEKIGIKKYFDLKKCVSMVDLHLLNHINHKVGPLKWGNLVSRRQRNNTSKLLGVTR